MNKKNKIKKLIKNSYLYRMYHMLKTYKAWSKRNFSAPSPQFIKQKCLIRNGYKGAIWIETGTYLGQTTEILANNAMKVYSIEPEPKLFFKAKELFSDFKNVEILNGTSEEVLPALLPKITGKVNFWLDGHYSADVTYRGSQDTPIRDELKSISDNFKNFEMVCVLIDDVRCFNPHLTEFSSYPPIEELVYWARKHDLNWCIEHDIFIAKTKNYS